jgi:hypothetical protein
MRHWERTKGKYREQEMIERTGEEYIEEHPGMIGGRIGPCSMMVLFPGSGREYEKFGWVDVRQSRLSPGRTSSKN